MSEKTNPRAVKRAHKKTRIKKKLLGTTQRPRLAVFRSSKNIYAQLIDDVKEKTVAGVSTLTPDILSEAEKAKNKIEAAKIVGKAIAEKAKSLKIEQVVFDRGGYLYHGRVKALADGARENGLKF